MAGGGTVDELLWRAWRLRFAEPAPERDWGRAVQPRHIRKWILRLVAGHPDIRLAELRPAGDPGRAPRPAGLLPPLGSRLRDEHPRLRGWVGSDEFWAVVEALTTIADEQARAVTERIRELPPARRGSVTRKDVSEWAARIVVRPLHRAPALPAESYLAAERERFLQRVLSAAAGRDRLPTRAEFAARYREAYDRVWARRGAAALRATSPAALGVGSDAQPPMVRPPGDDGSELGAWRDGTDYAVAQRYGRYLRRADDPTVEAAARRFGLDPDRHLVRRLPDLDPDQVCRGELERVCDPLGLREPPHRALVAAVAMGTLQADVLGAYEARVRGVRRVRRGGRVAEWAAAAPRLPAGEDAELVAAVRETAEYWAARDAMAECLVLGAPRYWPRQIELAAPRRMWHLLHGHEVTWAAELDRPAARTWVEQVFSRHLVELLATPIREPEPGLPAPDDPRLAATLRRVHADRAAGLRLCALILSGDPGWRTQYARVVGDDRDCLPADRFREWAECTMAAEAWVG